MYRYLYINGVVNSEICGDFSCEVNRNSMIFSKMDDRIRIQAQDGGLSAYISTVKKINLNGYSKLCIVSSYSGEQNWTTIKLDSIILKDYRISGHAKSTENINISSYNGNYTLTINLFTGGTSGDSSHFILDIFEIYLEA